MGWLRVLATGVALSVGLAGCATGPLPSDLGPEGWRSPGNVRGEEQFARDRSACLMASEVEIARPEIEMGPDSRGFDRTSVRDEHRFEACMNARGWYRIEEPGAAH